MTVTKQAFVTGSKRPRRQDCRDSKVEAGREGGNGSTAKGSRRGGGWEAAIRRHPQTQQEKATEFLQKCVIVHV